MTGYVRQSEADIQNDEVIIAADLNAEFDAIETAFDASSGHSHDGTTGEGPKISLTTSVSGVLPVANGGIAAIHKVNATGAPAVTDDTNAGYGPGSIWVDVTNDQAYVCVDSTVSAAVWRRTNIEALTFYNYIINNDFDIWQRGTSQTINGYGSDDHWFNGHFGSTKTHSQQTFPLGQTDVPGGPRLFSRTVVTSVANAVNFVYKQQIMEGVEQLAGKLVTVTFWAKADASRQIAIEMAQTFGSGGSPSAAVTGIGAQKISLTTSWQKFTRTITLPSVAGKTLGSNGDQSTRLFFWFDAGSNFNARAASLGQQSGTFDIAHVSLIEGDVTAMADPTPRRSIEEIWADCQRYYSVQNIFCRYDCSGAWIMGTRHLLPVRMRVAPTMAIANASVSVNVATANFYTPHTPSDFGFEITAAAAGSVAYQANITADAEFV